MVISCLLCYFLLEISSVLGFESCTATNKKSPDECLRIFVVEHCPQHSNF